MEVPVWVELSGIVGVLRLRMEMISEPPFVRHVKFCFPHLPKVEIVAKVRLYSYVIPGGARVQRS